MMGQRGYVQLNYWCSYASGGVNVSTTAGDLRIMEKKNLPYYRIM